MDADAVKKTAKSKVEAAKAEVDGPAEIWEVRGPEGGRRRAGYRFTPTPMLVDTGDLTTAERRAIAEDPVLSVKVMPAAPAADKSAEEPKPSGPERPTA